MMFMCSELVHRLLLPSDRVLNVYCLHIVTAFPEGVPSLYALFCVCNFLYLKYFSGCINGFNMTITKQYNRASWEPPESFGVASRTIACLDISWAAAPRNYLLHLWLIGPGLFLGPVD